MSELPVIRPELVAGTGVPFQLNLHGEIWPPPPPHRPVIVCKTPARLTRFVRGPRHPLQQFAREFQFAQLADEITSFDMQFKLVLGRKAGAFEFVSSAQATAGDDRLHRTGAVAICASVKEGVEQAGIDLRYTILHNSLVVAQHRAQQDSPAQDVKRVMQHAATGIRAEDIQVAL